MCGICGIKLPTSGPIGRYLVDMCQAMRHRGYDSTGFALYGEPVDGRLVLRLRIVEAAHTHAALDALEGALRERGVTLADEHEADAAVDAPDRFVRALVKRGHRSGARHRARDRRRRARHRGAVDRALARDHQGPRRRRDRQRAPRRRPLHRARTASGTCA